MFTKTEKRGMKEETQYDLLICTMNEGDNEHSHGAVSHPIGSDKITIRSNCRSWGSIPIEGKDNIAMLRDALNLVCEKMGI